jgi:uncharacterized protein (DUF2267 family)
MKERTDVMTHELERYVDAANVWIDELVELLELEPSERRRAVHALRAGLHAIRDRLPAVEVVQLAAQLPLVIRGLYYERWRLANDPGAIRTREAMVGRVAAELEPDLHLDPVDVLRAVIHLLVEHVSPGEILDIVSTLPRPIAGLWHDLTGHALDTLAEVEHGKPMH